MTLKEPIKRNKTHSIVLRAAVKFLRLVFHLGNPLIMTVVLPLLIIAFRDGFIRFVLKLSRGTGNVRRVINIPYQVSRDKCFPLGMTYDNDFVKNEMILPDIISIYLAMDSRNIPNNCFQIVLEWIKVSHWSMIILLPNRILCFMVLPSNHP